MEAGAEGEAATEPFGDVSPETMSIGPDDRNSIVRKRSETAQPDPLFRPFRDGALALSNRIVMAPMTRYFSPNGIPGSDVARYYARRAAGGVGLIITEGAFIPHASAHGFTNVPRFYGDDALSGWREVVRAVHQAGARIFPQLWHAGVARKSGMEPDAAVPAFSPSATSNGLCKAMSEEDIADVIEAYAQSAADAERLGFDGVELHGAHGYLIDAFLWHETNRREDGWGGALDKRARFPVEIVRAIRRRVRADFPISFRWSQFKQQDYRAQLGDSPDALELFLGPLADAGVTIFHASGRRFWEPAFPLLSDLTLAGWTKRLTSRPTIAVGSVGLASVMAVTGAADVPGGGYSFRDSDVGGEDQQHMLEDMLAREEFDLVAVGRSLLADPLWPKKMRAGRLDQRIAFEKTQLSVLE